MKTKQNKLFIMMMTLMLVATAFFSAPVKTSADVGPNVQLISAKGISKDNHLYTIGYIKTTLSSSIGSVVIHYQVDNGTWQDSNANCIGVKDNSYNLWYFQIDGGIDPLTYAQRSGVNFRFAIKYSINGQDYWDNNNTNDYKISSGYTDQYGYLLLNAANLSLSSAEYYTGNDGNKYFNGTVTLKNLSYNKAVKIVYSYDNWATVNSITATYSDTDVNGLEDWQFEKAIPNNVTQIKFAISYTVNGITYWDNNFENNYTLNITGSSYGEIY